MNTHEAANALKKITLLCRERGVRLTDQRKAILQLLFESDKPLTAYELLDRMRTVMDNPAPPTVYRALDFLLEQGLIHKLESLHAYIRCTHPDRPHSCQFLICDDCGVVIETENPSVAKSLKMASKAVGFHAKRPVVEVLGTCDSCSSKKYH